MILAKNVYKSYNDLPILKGIDLEIKAGEVVSIVGPSGAGKTTLLHVIGGLTKSTTPKEHNTQILIDQQDLAGLNDRKLSKFRNKNLGFIFQFHQLLPEFDALENVMLPALIGGKNRNDSEKRAKELLEFFGLGHRLNHRPKKLSGGEQQRVSVARALMNNPKVVFADEPSGNLDSKNADELHQLFFDLRDEFEQTFVIVTHNRALAEMSDRILEMEDGRILGS